MGKKRYHKSSVWKVYEDKVNGATGLRKKGEVEKQVSGGTRLSHLDV